MYEYSIDDSKGALNYSFKTDKSIEYSVYLAPSTRFDINIGIEDLYVLGLQPVTVVEKYYYDAKIFPTVRAIIKDFFERCNWECCIVYYPDAEDGKDRKRDMLFDRWFRRVESEGFKRKAYRILGPEYQDVYSTTLLYHENHTDCSQVINRFISWQKVWNLQKI